MRVRIVVADRSEARFYDAAEPHGLPLLKQELHDEQGRLHDRDYKSDRPGRVFDHAAGNRRRGAVGHHATGGERSPSKHEADEFARRIAHALHHAHSAEGFDRLVLAAEPAFLGRLRAALPETLQALVHAEIHKDLVHADARAIAASVPVEAYIGAM
ncbi:MAG: host attachment protein [Gammaproteobacteria bacterium]|nr:host attachment protein [Gammaproteobacteria bacterium]